jgi:hypothetical protein
MPATERKFWPKNKKHEHVLGEIRKVSRGDQKITCLYLYEQSVERGNEPAELPKPRISAIVGACNGIVCTICGESLDWIEPPSVSYERLFSRYNQEE